MRLAKANSIIEPLVHANDYEGLAAKKIGDDILLPLALANVGEELIIKRIGGAPDTKRHLCNLGFVVGGQITVINTLGGNLIVSVKEARVAISKEMAGKIFV